METLRNYLDNMFAALPEDTQMQVVKAALAADMEDRFNELTAAGKSESEAIGIVISEFGDIRELAAEMGRQQEAPAPPQPAPVAPAVHMVGSDEAEAFLVAKQMEALITAVGVLLVLVGVACFMLMIALGGEGEFLSIIGILVMLLFIATATGLFIWSDTLTKPFKYLKKQPFVLPRGLEQQLRAEKQRIAPMRTLLTSVGVGLCVLCPAGVLLPAALNAGEQGELFGIAVLLLMVGVGSALLTYAGSAASGYNRLLGEKEDD